jgi:hypothetical protein
MEGNAIMLHEFAQQLELLISETITPTEMLDLMFGEVLANGPVYSSKEFAQLVKDLPACGIVTTPSDVVPTDPEDFDPVAEVLDGEDEFDPEFNSWDEDFKV